MLTCCSFRRTPVTRLRKACRLRRSLSLLRSASLPNRLSNGPKVASSGPPGPPSDCSIGGTLSWAISFCADLINESPRAWPRVPACPCQAKVFISAISGDWRTSLISAS
ncbi:hypothetical protein D3C73_892250 [compost metagenome]